MSASKSEFGQVVVRPFLLVAFIVVQIFLLTIPRHDTLDLEAWPNTQPSPRIFGTRTVGQSFIPRINNMSRIDIFTGTYGLTLSSDLLFRLYEGGLDGRLAAAVRIPGPKVRDNLFTPVEFKPIKKSRGKVWTFVLSAPGAGAAEGPSLWFNPSDLLPTGALAIDGRPSPGDGIFRTYSRRTILAEWERISHGVPGRWGNPFALAVVAMLFEIALAVAFWRILGWFFEPQTGMNDESPEKGQSDGEKSGKHPLTEGAPSQEKFDV
jgi:hypothetical protein